MPGSAGPRAVTGEQIRGWHTQSLRQTLARRGVRLVQTALVPTDAYAGHKRLRPAAISSSSATILSALGRA